MASEETVDTDGRPWVRIGLVGCCVLAAVIASLLVPSLASGDLAGTPIDSVLPGERLDNSDGGGGGNGFGALNPGDTTGVGGETGLDNGTFASNDTEVHFTVESSQPAYWRTGAYDSYTGSGWERTGSLQPYQPPIEQTGLRGERVEFDVQLAQSATAIPTVWRPRRLSGVEDISLTETGALQADTPIEAGAVYAGVSYKQEDSVDVLRAAGDDYPNDIERRYTQLPDDTPSRIERLTSNLTADDENVYDAAMTIQNWLRTQKDYSLEATRQSDHIADTFIFEMEAGYCEYFATAMTAMLRSQGIPARYTVGYSTGQQVEDNTYEVRGMNAHAWVEVYFPDVGWVKFDPTPGGARLAAQSDVLEEELGEVPELGESGSPGERFEPGEVRETTDGDEDNETDETDGAYDIELNRTAVPGMTVEVLVTYDDDPAPNRKVYFNGELVGQTDVDGIVVGRVPDADELEITVEEADIEIVDQSGNVSLRPAPRARQPDSGQTVAPPDGAPVPPPEESNLRLGAASTPPALSTALQTDDGANETYPIETGATVTLSGDVLPGQTVTITATVEDVAIPSAEVIVDGAVVATTDEAGQAEIVLPDDPGEVTIAVERSAISGAETFVIPELSVTVETGRIGLPLAPATVTVTADDRSIADAPVEIGGTRVATTGPDGTAQVRLPLSNTATIAASKYGMRDTATVDGLLVNLLVLLLGAGALVGFPALLLARRGYDPRALPAHLASSASTALQYGQRALVTVANDGSRWLVLGASRLRRTAGHLRDAVRGQVAVTDLRRAFETWLQRKRRWLRRRGSDTGQPDVAPDERADAVRQSWRRLLEELSVSDPGKYTPGELATHAVERDRLPPDAVRTLRDAFREVEYGARPAAERVEQVQRAIQQIETQSQQDRTRTSSRAAATPRRMPDQPDRVTADGGQTPTEHGGEH